MTRVGMHRRPCDVAEPPSDARIRCGDAAGPSLIDNALMMSLRCVSADAVRDTRVESEPASKPQEERVEQVADHIRNMDLNIRTSTITTMSLPTVTTTMSLPSIDDIGDWSDTEEEEEKAQGVVSCAVEVMESPEQCTCETFASEVHVHAPELPKEKPLNLGTDRKARFRKLFQRDNWIGSARKSSVSDASSTRKTPEEILTKKVELLPLCQLSIGPAGQDSGTHSGRTLSVSDASSNRKAPEGLRRNTVEVLAIGPSCQTEADMFSPRLCRSEFRHAVSPSTNLTPWSSQKKEEEEFMAEEERLSFTSERSTKTSSRTPLRQLLSGGIHLKKDGSECTPRNSDDTWLQSRSSSRAPSMQLEKDGFEWTPGNSEDTWLHSRSSSRAPSMTLKKDVSDCLSGNSQDTRLHSRSSNRAPSMTLKRDVSECLPGNSQDSRLHSRSSSRAPSTKSKKDVSECLPRTSQDACLHCPSSSGEPSKQFLLEGMHLKKDVSEYPPKRSSFDVLKDVSERLPKNTRPHSPSSSRAASKELKKDLSDRPSGNSQDICLHSQSSSRAPSKKFFLEGTQLKKEISECPPGSSQETTLHSRSGSHASSRANSKPCSSDTPTVVAPIGHGQPAGPSPKTKRTWRRLTQLPNVLEGLTSCPVGIQTRTLF